MPRWRRKSREEDLERELRADLELEAEEQQERGLSAEQAGFAARRAQGNAALVKEEVRAAWGWLWLGRLGQDLRYALRGMRRSPGFTATAVLSLALGIGANTAIFGLINAVMLRWLPVRAPEELVQLVQVGTGPEPVESFPYPLVRGLAEHREIFASLCGFAGTQFVVGQGEAVEPSGGAWVSGEYYQTLGLRPAAGRLLTPADDREGAAPAAVITDGYWARKYGRDPRAIGGTILIEGKPVMIVGVSPAGFTGANVGSVADITLALGALPQVKPEGAFQIRDAGAWWLRVLARPRTGVSRPQIKARLAGIWRPLGESVIPANKIGARRRVERTTVDVTSGGTGWSVLRRQFRKPLLVLMAVTGVLLLIACANVANLLLARTPVRQREIAVRMAIGAGRARVVRQLLTESLLLAVLGAALGIALAWLGGEALVRLLAGAGGAALALDVGPDWQVLAFTGAVAMVTALLFGTAPAVRGTAAGPMGALREKAARAGSRLAPVLVTAQVSLTLLLMIGGGLFIGTLRNLQHLDPGFRTEGVLLADADCARLGYRGARSAALYEELLGQIEGLPGVRAASLSLITPLSGGGFSQTIAVNGRPAGTEEIAFNYVARRYFETMQTAVIAGREFTGRDNATAPKVAVVNQGFVRQYMEGNPLGQHLTVGTGAQQPEYEIVGLVRDARYDSLREAAPPTVFVPLAQRQPGGGYPIVYEVRANGSLAGIAASLRATLQPRLPGSPVEVHGFTQQMEGSLVQERMMATLAAGFAALGLVLAVVGVYGLLAYTVARRTHEIGIRMALGATREAIVWGVLRRALAMLGCGIAAGIPAAWAASRLVTAMLYGLTPMDPWTIGVAAAALAVAGLAAGLAPAWKAAKVDPWAALRYE
jgi:predicted permease